ncbi:MAG: zf-HC2 domain-containing protein [Proteobacteria bacterium]|nr:zf-HC2 domain-containing protein [Pseudomonadota bacterium]
MSAGTPVDSVCDAEAARLLPWFVTGRLSSDDRGRVEQHVRDCAVCRADLEAQRRIRAALRADGTVEYAPQAGLAATLARIDELARDGAPSAAPPAPPPGAPHPPYAAHVLTGLLMALLGLVLAAITIAWIVALASLVTTGAIFGWWLPHDVPFWAALLILVVVYNLVVWPIKAARRAAYGQYGGYRAYHGPWVAAWDGVATLAVVVLVGWYAYHHVPEVRDLLDHLRGAFDHAVHALGGGTGEPSRMIGTDLLGTVLAVVRADHRVGLEGLQ